MTTTLRLVVEKVIQSGKHGPYAVVRDPQIGSITFSLTTKVWKEKVLPEEGSEVILEDIQRKRAGWRAMSARFLRTEDVRPSSA